MSNREVRFKIGGRRERMHSLTDLGDFHGDTVEVNKLDMDADYNQVNEGGQQQRRWKRMQ